MRRVMHSLDVRGPDAWPYIETWQGVVGVDGRPSYGGSLQWGHQNHPRDWFFSTESHMFFDLNVLSIEH